MQEKSAILIIDDDPRGLAAFSQRLNQAGYSVKSTNDVAKGLKLLLAEKIDCVLLNYRLAAESGLPLAKKIKSESALEFIPAIILTGLDREEDILDGLNSGADDYITASSSPEMALTRLKAILRTKYLRDSLAQLNKAASELKDISVRDSLTGLYNRKYLLETLDMEISRAKRCKYNICCLMLDIDYYKLVNDNYGHAFGDFVLKEFGACVKACFRESDVLARYGGDEFIVLMVDIDYAGVFNVAERFRRYIERYDFREGERSVKLTVSIGISSLLEDGDLNKDKFLYFADTACYEAKARGRNNSVAYKELAEEASLDKVKLAETEDKMYSVAEYSKKSYIEAIKNLIFAWEENNPKLRNHTEGVLEYVRLITSRMGLPKNEVEVIENAASLHDLGMLLITDPLDAEMAKKHPLLTVHLLSKNKFMRLELPIILYHHENFDGSGYPSSLEGKRIPLGARIIQVADTYAAICSEQLQGDKPQDTQEATRELAALSGSRLDPEIVAIFVKALEK